MGSCDMGEILEFMLSNLVPSQQQQAVQVIGNKMLCNLGPVFSPIMSTVYHYGGVMKLQSQQITALLAKGWTNYCVFCPLPVFPQACPFFAPGPKVGMWKIQITANDLPLVEESSAACFII